MKGGEAKFWNEIRQAFKSMGHYDRVESHATSIGRPDVNLCLNGGVVWDIELKYSDTVSTRVRPAQRGWFHGRRRVGGNCAVFTKWVKPDETLYLLNIKFPDDADLHEWVKYSDAIWEDIDWGEFEEILRLQDAKE